MTTINNGSTTITPIQVLGYTSARPANNVFHPTLGGGLDVTLIPAGLRTGTLTFLFDNEDDAAACESVHSLTAVLRLLDPDLDTVGMFYVPNGSITRALDEDTRAVWTVAVDFQEVPSA